MVDTRVPGSFRDPSGFVFLREGDIYRQVNRVYKEHYDELLRSGLYDDLVASSLIIPHEEITGESGATGCAYKVLKPQKIPFVSYPYEWCFSQLKDAALTTLEIQKKALVRGMTLKDSSSYNIQFLRGKPCLVDTLSFEKYEEGNPWVAYKQFCEHFLAPLALMSYTDVRLGQIARINLDGVPLNLAKALLPFRTRLKFSLLMHVHLHVSAQRRFSGEPLTKWRRQGSFTLRAFRGLLDSLEVAVEKLSLHRVQTDWINYYQDNNYLAGALQCKKALVSSFLQEVR